MAELPEVILAGDLELRRCRREFLDALMSAIRLSQAELACWLPWADPIPTVEAELEFLRGREVAFSGDQDWGFSIFEIATGELVGGAGLQREIRAWQRSGTGCVPTGPAAAMPPLPPVRSLTLRSDTCLRFTAS